MMAVLRSGCWYERSTAVTTAHTVVVVVVRLIIAAPEAISVVVVGKRSLPGRWNSIACRTVLSARSLSSDIPISVIRIFTNDGNRQGFPVHLLVPTSILSLRRSQG